MALSSWLGFGKKKTPVDVDNSAAVAAEQDDYVVIEHRSDGMYPSLGDGGSSMSLPYQVQPVPGHDRQSGMASTTDVQSSNPLDDVPFKLSSLLAGGGCEWSRSDAAHFKSVMSRAIHNNETIYKYDFSHENSIMRESSHGSVDIG